MRVMATYRYTFTGEGEIHLPLHGITTDPTNPAKVYETDIPVRHPDFAPVAEKKEGTAKHR